MSLVIPWQHISSSEASAGHVTFWPANKGRRQAMAYDRAWEGLLVSTCYHQRGFEDGQTPLALNDHGALLRVLGLGWLCHCSYRLTTLGSKRSEYNDRFAPAVYVIPPRSSLSCQYGPLRDTILLLVHIAYGTDEVPRACRLSVGSWRPECCTG